MMNDGAAKLVNELGILDADADADVGPLRHRRLEGKW